MSGLLRATFRQVLSGRCCRVGASEMKLIILHTFAHQVFDPGARDETPPRETRIRNSNMPVKCYHRDLKAFLPFPPGALSCGASTRAALPRRNHRGRTAAPAPADSRV